MEEKKDKDSKIKSQIGGQAVLEGVMMKGKSSMATAVRDEDGIIRIESKRLNIKTGWFYKLTIIRGDIAFVQSLVGGTKVLTRSAEVFGEGEPTKFEKWLSEKFKINIMSVITTLSMVIGVVLAVFLFMFLPQQFRIWIVGEDCNVFAKNFIEGGFKLVIFISYILLVSLLKDIRRVFMYHGAEHKTITCFEKGLPLTVENARACRRVHDRCGTTFIVFVMVISILVFALFESLVGIKLKAVLDTAWLYNVVRILCKLALLPIVAGLSYELLKGLSKTDSFIVYPLKVPGLLLQRITTREPNDDMLEVAITAFNTVMELDANPEMKTRDFTVAMKRSELLKKVKAELSEYGITEDAEAEWIIAITLNIKRSEVFSDALVSPKYIDEINNVANLQSTFRGCTSLENAPKIPDGVDALTDTFYNCTSLKNAPIMPDGIINMYETFCNCDSLTYKPVIPSTVIVASNCYYGVTTKNWKGTRSQVETFNPTCPDDCEIQIYNNDRVTLGDTIYNIDISTLSTYLARLTPNTISTAYKIYIRGLTSSNVQSIPDAMVATYETRQVYVDLSYTTLPQGTDCRFLFNTLIPTEEAGCKTLVKSPVLPTDATSLQDTFSARQKGSYCRDGAGKRRDRSGKPVRQAVCGTLC